ncbi:unnamed protein product [Cyprideis torosa]|uniref:Uncharacterized protein n=1 Tax=Cyprideis torosa TaxID=163714 RepID=A0A7R8ZQ24_9CRUS|nr:unnamed protein product [Cyprideis torosa]CAG0889645.1 unnamed protein product [Cyprideis torosa]
MDRIISLAPPHQAIGIVCIGLLRGHDLSWGSGDKLGADDRKYVGITTIGGMLLVSIPMFLAHFFGDSGIDKTALGVLQNFIGSILYLITGIMALEYYTDQGDSDNTKAGIALGALSLVNALAYALDSFFAFRGRKAS